MTYLGVDPGASGGIGILVVHAGKVKVRAVRMPETEKELWDIIREYSVPQVRGLDHCHDVYAVLEKVGGVVADTRDYKGMGAGMFAFGRHYGLCWMALVAAGIPFDLVHPSTWQSRMGVRLGNRKRFTRSERKNALKNEAKRLFPHLKVTLAIADALLLAEYARRSRKGGCRC